MLFRSPVVPDYIPYTHGHIISQLQLLLFSGLAFAIMLPLLKRTDTISLDFDWFYRGLGRYIISAFYYVGRFPVRISVIVAKKIMRKGLKVLMQICHPDEGVMARNWSMSVTVTWTAALLGIYLVVYYLT